MRSIDVTAAWLALFTLAVACGGTPSARPAGPATLGEREWVLASLGDEIDPRGAGSRAPTLRFDTATSRASGFAGCNRFTGAIVLAGDRLAFGPIATTRMACPDGMGLEQRFLAMLGATTSYRIADASLLLGGASGPLARFRAP